MRHSIQPRPTTREITPRRLAAAERALRLERERLPLFADQVAAEQPSAEERIKRIDAEHAGYWQSHRDLAASHWRWGRRILSEYPAYGADILAKWEVSSIPPTAAYFADFVRRELRALGVDIPG